MTDLEQLAKDYADDPRILALLADLDAARAEVDRCAGCGTTLSRCLRWHHDGLATGRVKCCPECEHPAEAVGFTSLRAERDALAAKVAVLRALCRESQRVSESGQYRVVTVNEVLRALDTP